MLTNDDINKITELFSQAIQEELEKMAKKNIKGAVWIDDKIIKAVPKQINGQWVVEAEIINQ